jgi:hypothetical protein
MNTSLPVKVCTSDTIAAILTYAVRHRSARATNPYALMETYGWKNTIPYFFVVLSDVLSRIKRTEVHAFQHSLVCARLATALAVSERVFGKILMSNP